MLDGEDTATGSRSLLLKACSVSLSKSVQYSAIETCAVFRITKD